MKPLVAFEAAARLESFTRAAGELHLTHGAVSRQIALLEAHFGLPLFTRRARGVGLTAAGERLRRAVDAMVGELRAVSNELRAGPAAGRVEVSVTPSFGAHWLIPRLRRFHDEHPEVPVQLNASLALHDLERAHYDFAIRDLAQAPAGGAALLMRDTLAPVCAPALVGRIGELPLLHDTDHGAWRQWLAAAGRPDVLGRCAGIVLNDYNLVLEAAMNGLGVAMGRLELVEAFLSSGRLAAPFAVNAASSRGHYLVKPARALRKPASLLWDWLLNVQATKPSATS